jgi:hypothetical protein
VVAGYRGFEALGKTLRLDDVRLAARAYFTVQQLVQGVQRQVLLFELLNFSEKFVRKN